MLAQNCVVMHNLLGPGFIFLHKGFVRGPRAAGIGRRRAPKTDTSGVARP